MPAMYKPFEVFIGLRYVRAKRRNHFISFISLISMAGIALGVMALITVLSVMNGFEKELKDRILGMASHATVFDYSGEVQDWRKVAEEVRGHPEITGVAQFINAEGMLVNSKRVRGTSIQGVLPEQEPEVSVISEKMISGELNNLQPKEFGIVLGSELSRSLAVLPGGKVNVSRTSG